MLDYIFGFLCLLFGLGLGYAIFWNMGYAAGWTSRIAQEEYDRECLEKLIK